MVKEEISMKQIALFKLALALPLVCLSTLLVSAQSGGTYEITQSVIANGGVLVRPHLIDRIDGHSVSGARGHRVVSRGVAEQMLSMLRGVVLEGTGTEAAIPGYTVAGKTGTAAKIDPDGTYSTSRYVASFVGLVPATKPKLVIMVMVDEPHGDIYGGVVAAPAFREIARFNLQHLEIPQDAPKSAPTSR